MGFAKINNEKEVLGISYLEKIFYKQLMLLSFYLIITVIYSFSKIAYNAEDEKARPIELVKDIHGISSKQLSMVVDRRTTDREEHFLIVHTLRGRLFISRSL